MSFKIFILFLFMGMCECIIYLFEEVLDLSYLELQAVVRYVIWILAVELWSSGRTEITLND